MLKSKLNKVQTELDHSEGNPQPVVYKTDQCIPGRATQLHILTQHM